MSGITIQHGITYFNEDTPVGVVMPYAGAYRTLTQHESSLGPDWTLCDGKAIGRARYQELFENIGTTYGTGDGISTFNVPNLQGFSVIGGTTVGTVTGTSAASVTGAADATTTGAAGTVGDHGQNNAASSSAAAGHTHTEAAHTHVIPSLAVNFLIKVE